MLRKATARAIRALALWAAILVPYAILVYTYADLTPYKQLQATQGKILSGDKLPQGTASQDIRALTEEPAAVAADAAAQPAPASPSPATLQPSPIVIAPPALEVVATAKPKARSAGEARSEAPTPIVADPAAQPAPASPPPATPQPSLIVSVSPALGEAPEAAAEPKACSTGEAGSDAPAPAVADVARQTAPASPEAEATAAAMARTTGEASSEVPALVAAELVPPEAPASPPETPQPAPIMTLSPTPTGSISKRPEPLFRRSVPPSRIAIRTTSGKGGPGLHARLTRLSVMRDAHDDTGVGRAIAVGAGAAGKGGRWVSQPGGFGSNGSSARAIGGLSSSGEDGGHGAGKGNRPGRSVTSVASLYGREGAQWRPALKRRCPSILESSAEYDDDLVWLCRVSARSN
ncbi:Cell pole-organizing protein PopZ [Rhizobiales bacterium GAS191]|nr:Cell pole-organizing protein PopZ [Rhizobiales bacterium GAS191]